MKITCLMKSRLERNERGEERRYLGVLIETDGFERKNLLHEMMLKASPLFLIYIINY